MQADFALHTAEAQSPEPAGTKRQRSIWEKRRQSKQQARPRLLHSGCWSGA